jgi:hypothetical protein
MKRATPVFALVFACGALATLPARAAVTPAPGLAPGGSGRDAATPAPGPALQPAAPPPASPTGLVVQLSSMNQAIGAVQIAKDPSAALTAYSSGLTIDRNDTELHRAFVGKMVDFDLPDQAAFAASFVVAHDPLDGLARAVQAFAEAKRGDMIAALSDAALAANQQAGDLFIQRTAGQLLAWYDSIPQPPPLSAPVKDLLTQVRAKLSNQKGFQTAYQQATAQYADQAQQAAQELNNASAAATATEPAPLAPPPPAGVVVPPGNGTTPVNNYYTANYYADAGYGSGYYSPYWNGLGLWWWWSPGFVVLGNFDHHHRHFDAHRFFHDHDGDFNHNHAQTHDGGHTFVSAHVGGVGLVVTGSFSSAGRAPAGPGGANAPAPGGGLRGGAEAGHKDLDIHVIPGPTFRHETVAQLAVISPHYSGLTRAQPAAIAPRAGVTTFYGSSPGMSPAGSGFSAGPRYSSSFYGGASGGGDGGGYFSGGPTFGNAGGGGYAGPRGGHGGGGHR